ncbi:cytochrome C [Opitutaceae bacterium EW11]|nr:cytochrome C [Opitutaceae bacterium EW11]
MALLAIGSAYASYEYYHSSYWHSLGLARGQPVLFSHRHHAQELGIDCRYCHASVQTAAFAGMPSTHTCMTCHSQIFTDTPMLKPVVDSARSGQPLRWTRVNSLPDHVYFDHGIHVAKGIGCTSCHGSVGKMALIAKGQPLTMRWCLDCHRDPAPHLRPEEEIFSLSWTPPSDQPRRGRELMAHYGIERSHLTNCSTCHR